MELKYFISETLSQIIDGVLDAQDKVKKSGKNGGRVSPHVRTISESASLYGRTNDKLPVILVNFDV